MRFQEKAAVFIATGCYAGFAPKAPGTIGSILGLPVSFLLARTACPVMITAIVLLIMLSVWTAGIAEKKLGSKDPGCIVIDEIAGMTIALAGIPFQAGPVFLAFIFFRFFDILKPYPISALERKLSGGVGIVADDLAAGLLANLLVRFLFAASLL